MDKEDVRAIEIGGRAYYTSDNYEDIAQRARIAQFFAYQETRQRDLLSADPQAALFPARKN